MVADNERCGVFAVDMLWTACGAGRAVAAHLLRHQAGCCCCLLPPPTLLLYLAAAPLFCLAHCCCLSATAPGKTSPLLWHLPATVSTVAFFSAGRFSAADRVSFATHLAGELRNSPRRTVGALSLPLRGAAAGHLDALHAALACLRAAISYRFATFELARALGDSILAPSAAYTAQRLPRRLSV